VDSSNPSMIVVREFPSSASDPYVAGGASRCR
jgi:hypothetical protein